MQTGAFISGLLHAALILWALVAGFFLRGGEPLPIDSVDVTVMSAEDFQALFAAPDPGVQQPAEPAVETQAPTLPVEPDETAATEPEPPAPVETPTPPAPVPVVQPDETAVPDVAPSPEPPAPVQADRVAPEPVPQAPDDADRGPDRVEAIVQEDTTEPAPEAPPEQIAKAPEAATTEIVTEATETVDKPVAPTRSVVPVARPDFSKPAPDEPTPVAEQPAETAPRDDSAAINNALAQALAEPVEQPQSRLGGGQLSAGEEDALRRAMRQCWNVGSLSTDALRTTVTVYMQMEPDGRPNAGSIRMIGYEGGGESAAAAAFEVARRAIIRCGTKGFDLPREKYSQWQEIEMIFNPENMRSK